MVSVYILLQRVRRWVWELSIAEKLIEELRSREDLRDALAEEIALSLVKDRRVRMMLAMGILREVATKSDIQELRQGLREEIGMVRREMKEEIGKVRNELREGIDMVRKEIDSLREEMRDLDRRLSRVEGMLNLLVKIFIAFNVPILVALIGILIKLALGG